MFNASTATLQAQEGKITRLLLPGDSGENGKSGHRLNDIIKLSPGDRLTFSSADLAEEELIPDTQVSDAITGGAVAKGQIEVTHDLVNAAFSPQAHAKHASKQHKQGTELAQYTGMLVNPNTVMSGQPQNLSLESGMLFLHAGTAYNIKIPDGTTVKIAKGAIAQLDCENGIVRIKALSGPAHVKLELNRKNGRRLVVLHAGQELLISDHRPTLKEVFPEDGIGRRQILALGLDQNATAILSDFSVIGMLAHQSHLSPLRHAQTAQAKNTHAHIMKLAAALDVVTKNRGPFYMPSKHTAQTKVPEWALKESEMKLELLALLK